MGPRAGGGAEVSDLGVQQDLASRHCVPVRIVPRAVTREAFPNGDFCFVKTGYLSGSAMAESTTPPRRRSTSRSRRKHPSFSDLRLAPLSAPPPKQQVKQALESPRTPGSIDPATAHAYRHNHSTYLVGRSAPSTPGILSRSSSRRQPYGGLSRKSEEIDGHQDAENIDPSYFSYEGARPGPVEAGLGYLEDRPKSMSEAGLSSPDKIALKGKRYTRPLSTAAAPSQRPNRRSYHSGTTTPLTRSRPATSAGQGDSEDSWLTHATSFTNSLIAESKGQAWISTHSSTTNLQGYTQSSGGGPTAFSTYHNSSDSEPDDATLIAPINDHPKNRRSIGPGNLHLSATAPAFAPDHEPLRSPAAAAQQQGWGSRFGSRAPSTTTSRRGSRSGLARPAISGFTTPGQDALPPPTAHKRRAVPEPPARTADDDVDVMVPAFVDPEVQKEMEASLSRVRAQRAGEGEAEGYFAAREQTGREVEEGVEEEVARLARTPGFGLGGALGSGFGLIDRLVGMSTFAFDGEDVGRKGADEEEEEEDTEDEYVPATTTQVVGTTAETEGKKKKRRSLMVDLQGMFGRQQDRAAAKGNETETVESAEGGGWNDAAWLLSVASKVIL